jgi:hypothetical protein
MNPILYLVCTVFSALFLAKAMSMSTNPRYDDYVTWKALIISVVVSLIPGVNVITSVIVVYCFGHRIFFHALKWDWLNKPVIPKRIRK